MQTDGLIPIAFGDKDGWPAMGTFDILNLRHERLRLPRRADGRRPKWTDPKVKAVFEKWKELLPFQRPTTPA